MGAVLSLTLAVTACSSNANDNTGDNEEEAETQEDSEFIEYLKEMYGEDVELFDLDATDMYDIEDEDAKALAEDDEEYKEYKKIAKEPEEVLDLDRDINTFIGEDDIGDPAIFKIHAYYENTDTGEEVTNTDIMRREDVDSDEETFDYDFAVTYITDIEEDEDYIMFVGTQENNTDIRARTHHEVNVISRDAKEEVEEDFGMGEGLDEELEPDFDSQGFYLVPFDTEEIPKDLEVTLLRAMNVDSEFYEEDNDYIDFDFKVGTVTDYGDLDEEDLDEMEEELEEETNNDESEENDNNSEDSESAEASEEDEVEEDNGEVPKMFDGLDDEEILRAAEAELGEEEFQRQMDEGGGYFDLEQFRGKEPQNKENWDLKEEPDVRDATEEEMEEEADGEFDYTTPKIDELEDKYGEGATLEDLTQEEEDSLDMYEWTYFSEK